MNPLRDYRLKKGLSVRGLAELSKVHYTTINELETGKRKAEHYTLAKLANALGVDYIEFATLAKTPFEVDDSPKPKAA